jgi:DNA ligase-1
MKPTLAVDAVVEKLVYPLIAMPKLDGVRGLNVESQLKARSLKSFKNKALTALYSKPEFNGFDGELVAGAVTDPDLCRKTTSLVNTIKGSHNCGWALFDYVPNDEVAALPYYQRHMLLEAKVTELRNTMLGVANFLFVIPILICENEDELLVAEEMWLKQGYEGVIIRSMDGRYKYGRTTQKEATYLRIKRFVDGECEILELIEGETNNNVPQINELGQTYRTSHQENKVGNGMIGSFKGRALKDIKDPTTKKLLIAKDQIIVVTSGKMSHDERLSYYQNPETILGKIAKFKFFPKGQKDKPRFPTFQSFRDKVDM